jgi:hypothetical protein
LFAKYIAEKINKKSCAKVLHGDVKSYSQERGFFFFFFYLLLLCLSLTSLGVCVLFNMASAMMLQLQEKWKTEK